MMANGALMYSCHFSITLDAQVFIYAEPISATKLDAVGYSMNLNNPTRKTFA